MIEYILPEDEKETTKVRIELHRRNNDCIDVWMEGCCIIRFNKDGTFRRYTAIPASLGLQLDSKSRIKESEITFTSNCPTGRIGVSND